MDAITDDRSHAPSWMAATASFACLASAVIHGAAVRVHFDHGTRYGIAFVVMTVALAAAGLSVLLPARRFGLLVVAAVNVAIIGLWFVSRTTAWTGEKEAVGLADAVATMLEMAALGVSLAALHLPADQPSAGRSTKPAALLSTVAVIVLFTIPAVAQADEHDHGQAGHTHAAGDATATTDHAHTTDELASALSGAINGATGPASITGVFAGSATHSHGDASGTAAPAACTPTAEQVTAADQLLAQTTLALQHWASVNTAVAEGYRPLGFEPNGVNHYINQAYLNDGKVLDPTRPEALLYGRNKDGSLFPVGVMFMMDDKTAHGPQVGGCLTSWHAHGFPFAKQGELSTEMMHVWTIPLPGGPYAEHVESEYARLYLGIEGFAEDGNSTSGSGAAGKAQQSGTAASAQGFGALLSRLDTGTNGSFGIAAVLNALSVHRERFCEPTTRALIEARGADARTMNRICDPLINGPLPGAKSPDFATVAAAFAAARPK